MQLFVPAPVKMEGHVQLQTLAPALLGQLECCVNQVRARRSGSDPLVGVKINLSVPKNLVLGNFWEWRCCKAVLMSPSVVPCNIVRIPLLHRDKR